MLKGVGNTGKVIIDYHFDSIVKRVAIYLWGDLGGEAKKLEASKISLPIKGIHLFNGKIQTEKYDARFLINTNMLLSNKKQTHNHKPKSLKESFISIIKKYKGVLTK